MITVVGALASSSLLIQSQQRSGASMWSLWAVSLIRRNIRKIRAELDGWEELSVSLF
jgi:hypothetical protein